MKFCTFQRADGSVSAGFLHDEDYVVDMHAVTDGAVPSTMLEFLQAADANLELVQAAAARFSVMNDTDVRRAHGVHRLSDVQLLAPLPKPSSIRDFYAFEAHVKTARRNRGLEMVPEWYQFPVFYFTNHQAVLGPEEAVTIPPLCTWFDYELEIACVIGRKGRDIEAESATEYIFGFTVMNDWSARDIQREEMKVGLGPAKGKDFATSLGPWLVTLDELEPRLVSAKPPESGQTLQFANERRYNMEMRATVNGVVLSTGNYRDIYYTFEQMIARASQGVTLYPGDVLGSGTVGSGCILELGEHVHRWLQPGDVVELSIEGLGTLRNTVKG